MYANLAGETQRRGGTNLPPRLYNTDCAKTNPQLPIAENVLITPDMTATVQLLAPSVQSLLSPKGFDRIESGG